MTNREKYPNVPAHALPPAKKHKGDANGLTAAIIEYAQYRGAFAHRLSSEGRYRPGAEVTDVLGHKRSLKGQWLPGLNVGLPDVLICWRGRFIGVEVKVGKDRLSADQKKIEEQVLRAGGAYFVAKDLNSFITWFTKLE